MDSLEFPLKPFLKSSILSCLILMASGCASYQRFKLITEEQETPTIILRADYNQTWQAVIQVVKKFDIAIKNIESGVIKTRWMDNTSELNFSDSFGPNTAVKSAKFKLVFNVVKGFRSTREVTKVSILKRQLIEKDFLQGFKEIPSDTIQEKTLLYRIERLVSIDNKLKKIDEQREKEALENF